MAVTAEGIPIRCWTFPGQTSDQAIIKTIKDDLAGWMLNRVVWVCDSGFNSGENRAYLQRGGGHYIVAERVRGGSKEARAALARAGRYHKVSGNLELKEVRLGSGARAERFCVCHNPEVAERDRRVRENLVSYLEKRIVGSDNWSRRRRDELVGELRTTPGLYRLLRRTPDGLLRIDKGAIANEERFDGKFLLRTSDDTLSTTDIALAYKQLYEVERGWRDLKAATAIRLRPIYHRREDRIRSHVQICWLALAARPHDRTGDGRHLAERPQRARAHAPCHSRDQARSRRAAFRDHPSPAADPARPRHRRAGPLPRLRAPQDARVIPAHSLA